MQRLIQKLSGAAARIQDSLTLAFEQRQKSRQRVVLDSRREAALMLPPGTVLRDGDLLRGEDQSVVRVQAAPEPVMTARTSDPLRLARACYHLGNRHVAIAVGPGWVRCLRDHVLADMLEQLGLSVVEEAVVFEPESGAYAGTAPGARSPHATVTVTPLNSGATA
ncbi:MAG: urease accessory protein UreE [Proteobacteria bacterium]|nr:urease accessory protein UreE [Pseudomonadota bacterium]